MTSICRSKGLRAWLQGGGARFVNVGRQGHINVVSGHGLWRDGENLLGDSLQTH